jgi:hypothetical protein
MTSRQGPMKASGCDQCGAHPTEEAQLEVELISSASGCVARFCGDLVEGTRAVLYGVESILMNDSRVVLDLSGIVSFDGAGLEAALDLMDAVRGFSGSLVVGDKIHTGVRPMNWDGSGAISPLPLGRRRRAFDPLG